MLALGIEAKHRGGEALRHTSVRLLAEGLTPKETGDHRTSQHVGNPHLCEHGGTPRGRGGFCGSLPDLDARFILFGHLPPELVEYALLSEF